MPGMKLSLRSYGDRVVTHVHDFQQIVMPVTGTLDQRIGSISGAISPGHFAVIERGVQHAFRASGRNCFVVLDMDRPVVGLRCVIRPFGGNGADLVRYVAAELADGELGTETEFHLVALLARTIEHACNMQFRSRDKLDNAIARFVGAQGRGSAASTRSRASSKSLAWSTRRPTSLIRPR